MKLGFLKGGFNTGNRQRSSVWGLGFGMKFHGIRVKAWNGKRAGIKNIKGIECS